MIELDVDRALVDLPLFRRGKARDIYDLGDTLLIVASDRISAFDVVLPTLIPTKGALLTELSAFWFDRLRNLVPNHLIGADRTAFPNQLEEISPETAARSMVVRKAARIDVECVVRGYLAGSAWRDYAATGMITGQRQPAGLRSGDRLPEPVFTPAIKHDQGHDVTISPDKLADLIGADGADRLAAVSCDLYEAASRHAIERGIILADTKFEFGYIDGELALIDEALTPDSSRFWLEREYRPGADQPSLDKQFVRDWLDGSGWNKEPPAPALPVHVVESTVARYQEARDRLMGPPDDRAA